MNVNVIILSKKTHRSEEELSAWPYFKFQNMFKVKQFSFFLCQSDSFPILVSFNLIQVDLKQRSPKWFHVLYQDWSYFLLKTSVTCVTACAGACQIIAVRPTINIVVVVVVLFVGFGYTYNLSLICIYSCTEKMNNINITKCVFKLKWFTTDLDIGNIA